MDYYRENYKVEFRSLLESLADALREFPSLSCGGVVGGAGSSFHPKQSNIN